MQRSRIKEMNNIEHGCNTEESIRSVCLQRSRLKEMNNIEHGCNTEDRLSRGKMCVYNRL